MNTRRLISLVLVTTLLSIGAAARTRSAKALFDKAVVSFSVAEFEKSIALLRRAEKRVKDSSLKARVHLYLGFNHALLDQIPRAREAFRQALINDPRTDPRATGIKQSIITLFNSVRDTMRGRLRVTATRADAWVIIDGDRAGKVPLELDLPVGEHRIEVRVKDGKHKQVVLLNPGQVVKVQARLPKKLVPKVKPVIEDPPGGRRLWTWIAAGGALATLGVGIGLGVAARSNHGEWEDELGQDRQRWEELRDAGQRKALAANVLFGAAGAMAVAAAVLFFVEGRSGDPARGTDVGLAPLSGPGPGVMWTTSF